MTINNRVSTGLRGLDEAIDMLRLGDNVVWQVGSIEEYRSVVGPYVRQAKADGRRLVYFRFGNHEALLTGGDASVIYEMDASEGFESFATKVHNIIEDEGLKAFYVFDCLSDLLTFWYSDLMIGNFFRVTCPFLFQLDTIAYFALIRGTHTHATIARIRETTQLLLDIYIVSLSEPKGSLRETFAFSAGDRFYVHPLKVWERYSPTMFFPHLIDGDEATSITASAETAALFSGLRTGSAPRDCREDVLDNARAALGTDEEGYYKKLLTGLIIGKDERIAGLAEKYFSLGDLLLIAGRCIGTGLIGGKSVGMLLARMILDETDIPKSRWEPHDSFYLGADVFYTYIVQNGWWDLRCRQKTPEGYFALAPELREKLLCGKFPDMIREQFVQMLEYFGQSPIIVRSSSLLEDNFGNAFAGKYDSVFCANQGTPEMRFDAFEQAVRVVYASAMSDNALAYRKSRGLAGRDEQMAILVQRVSGDHYGELFFPHAAGVGNSSNLYVWDSDMDPDAGMLRLVFGLGTRAVDRVSGDYARIVSLDRPLIGPPVSHGDERKFSQHYADVLNLRENRHTEVRLDSLGDLNLKVDMSLFAEVDYAELARLRELGAAGASKPRIFNFNGLLEKTEFAGCMTAMLTALKTAYDYPVDIEFTLNFAPNGDFRINLLQCRPLQTKGIGSKAAELPDISQENVFFSSIGNFMGGNVRLPIDYVVFIKAREYLALSEQGKYQIARAVGAVNNKLKGSSVLLVGPGRWGTTTPSLGVPVHFSELCNMAAVCEVSYNKGELMPELSFGSHFFQDIVESGIFYAAIFEGKENVAFNHHLILKLPNALEDALPGGNADVIHIAKTGGLASAGGLCLHSDITAQKVLCGFGG